MPKIISLTRFQRLRWVAALFATAAISLAGCQNQAVTQPSTTVSTTVQPTDVQGTTVSSPATIFPSSTPLPTSVRLPTSTPTKPPAQTVWIDPTLPTDIHDALVKQVNGLAGAIAPDQPGIQLSPDQNADVLIGANPPAVSQTDFTLITRTFAIAAPFPTIADSITLSALTAFWQGNKQALNSLTNDQSTPTLYLDPDTRAGLVMLLGEPAASTPIQMLDASQLISATWSSRPSSFAILPFDQLEARWKLIWVDGMNLFEKQMDASQYPLTLRVRVHAGSAADTSLVQQLLPSTDRDVQKMAIVAMTGTTAMVRGTAVEMERNGITYPGEAIRDWMLTADVRHVSNEVSFWAGCPPPTFNDGLSMCSNPKYADLLKYMGVNLVELSGNHLWDKGAQYVSDTLKIYDDLGMKYFAGGRTYTESLQPVTMTVAGNHLAFVGCNWFGSDWVTLGSEIPGSALCGADDPHSLDLITPTIKSLTEQGYLVIATIQYEEYYTYEPAVQQVEDFNALRDAGALVVNGSQGHWVQAFDVNAKGFIHYGVGNLFFGDQEGIGTHQTFVDRHVFYDGKYLGTDLRSAFIVNYSRPEPMNAADRAKLLKTLFEADGY